MQSIPPIFIISLPEQKQRQARLAKQLNAMGLSYTITDAVDGRLLDLDNIHPPLDMAEHQRLWGEDMSRPEIGCFLSHYNLWQHIADHGLPYALIMEDDVIIDKDLAEIVERSLSSKWHWDIIRLSAFRATEQLVKKGCALDTIDPSNKKIAFKLVSEKISSMGNRFLVRYKDARDTAAYMITQSAARKLIKHYGVISEPVDRMYELSWQHGLYFFGIAPPVVRQLRQVQRTDEIIEPSALETCRNKKKQANKYSHKARILRAWYQARRLAKQRLWNSKNTLKER